MNIRKMQQLEKLGWDQDWLDNVKMNFHPKKQGKYEIKIYDIEHIDQDPETGIWIDTTSFDNDVELSIVHFFFEGFGYVMRDKATDEIFGIGIIDGAPFEECDDHESKPWGTWKWHSAEELGPVFAKQREEDLKKLAPGHARVRQRKIYTVTTLSKVDYDFSVEVKRHGAFESFDKAVKRLKSVVKDFKNKYIGDYEKYSNTEKYPDEESGAWTVIEDFENGYWRVSFGYEEDYELHQICIDEYKVEDSI